MLGLSRAKPKATILVSLGTEEVCGTLVLKEYGTGQCQGTTGPGVARTPVREEIGISGASGLSADGITRGLRKKN